MATDTWNGTGNWTSDPGDWSPSPPTSTDDAVIASGDDELTTSVTVASITIDSPAILDLEDTGGTPVSVTNDVTNAGALYVDVTSDDGGSTLSIGGTLSNSNYIAIGNDDLSASTTVSASGFDNTSAGTIDLAGNTAAGTAFQATLDITGMGAAGAAPTTLDGTISLIGDALVEFASGGITTIADGAELFISGAQARILTDGGTSSALSELSSNAGTFYLVGGNAEFGAGGASVTTSTGLDNTGYLFVDPLGGGSSLIIGGTLTNSGTIDIGNAYLSASTTVSATGLSNSSSGSIDLTGNTTAGTTDQATLDISGAAPTTLDGTIDVVGDALLEFGSGGIAAIGASATLLIEGAQAQVLVGTGSALSGLSSNAGTFEIEGGASVSTNTGLSNTDNIYVDGGGSLSIGGTLTNSNYVSIGDTDLSASTTVSATGLAGGGETQLFGNTTLGTTDQATLDISAPAPATLEETIYVVGDALLEFASGGITTIGGSTTLIIEGAQARVSIGGGMTNSALSGLSSNAGVFALEGTAQEGAVSVTTDTGLDNTNAILVDPNDFYGSGDGGSSLTIGGTLTNSGSVLIGNLGLTASTTVSATALDNTGTITLEGASPNTATLSASGTATIGAGTVYLYASGVLAGNAVDVTGGTILGGGAIDGPLDLSGGIIGADNINAGQTGILTVNGTYSQSAGTLLATINTADTAPSSVLAVAGSSASLPDPPGSVTLTGGTLSIDAQSALALNTPYTVMTFTAGDLSGTFGNVTTEGAGITTTSGSGNGNGITFTSGPDSGDTLQVLYNNSAGTIQVELVQEAPCFCRGTMILTPKGEVPVERLRIGDAVTTLSGAAKAITWIGSGRSLITAANARSRPIVVRQDAIADGVPCRDLHLTKGHSLHVDGVLIPVEFLVNGKSILWDDTARVVEFYHIELPEHDVLVADGTPAESYKEDGNREQFHNPDRPVVAAKETDWFAPVLTNGPVVDRVWRRLLDRSGFVRPKLTLDPDLHLIADGVRIDAERVADGAYRFRLEAPPSDLRIVSRSAVPLTIGRNHDPRRLGVAICSIVLRGPGATVALDYDSPWLAQGFHDPEPEPGFRWTTGDAPVPSRAVLPFDGGFELTLDIGGTVEYPIPEPGDAGLRAAA